MKKFKTFLLLAIAAAITVVLAAFAWENWEDQISVIFLGASSQSLPVAAWILLALLAGILTAVIISSLFGLSNYLTLREATAHTQEGASVSVRPEENRTIPDSETEPFPEGGVVSESGDRPEKKGFFKFKKPSPGPPPSGSGDDWAEVSSKEENWGSEGRSESVETNPNNYEAEQEPKSESWSGSVYSYGYKEPSGSGVGQSESVYDADYRIIAPPPQSTAPPTTEEEKEPDSKEGS